MATPAERLDALRKKKRLAELRAKRDASADTNVIKTASQPFEGRGGGVTEAATTVGTSLAGDIVGGLAGVTELKPNLTPEQARDVTSQEPLFRTPTTQERVETIEGVQEAVTVQPKTEEGAAALQTLGQTMEGLGRVLSLPLVGLEGLATAISTGDTELANQAMARMLDKGAGDTLGDRNLEAARTLGVESPEGQAAIGTAAAVLPQAAAELTGAGIGFRSARAAVRSTDKIRAALDRPDIEVFDDAGKFTEEAIEALEVMQRESAPKSPITPEDAAKIDEGIEGLNIVDEIVAEAVQDGAILTPEQARRLNLFREQGVPALRADITRRTDDSIQQQQAIKEGDPSIAPVAAAQDQALIQRTNERIQGTGGLAIDVDGTNSSIVSAVEEVALILDKKVSDAYQAARTAAQGQPVVNLDSLITVVKENKGRERITGGVLSSIRQTLKNRGIIGKDANTSVTVEIAEELRQELNADFPAATARGRSLIRELKDAIDNDVEKAAGSDIFGAARAEKIRFQKTLERAKRNKFDKTSGSFLEDVLDNSIPENQIFDRMTRKSFRDDDFIKMKQFLTEDAGDAGVIAWNNLRAQVLRNALDKATSTMQIKEAGQATFNVRLFRNELKKVRGKKYNELFTPDERQLIADIEEIGNSRIPIDKTVSGEGPSSIAINALRKTVLSRLGPIGEGAQGMIDMVTNSGRNRRLLKFTKDTEKAVKRGR